MSELSTSNDFGTNSVEQCALGLDPLDVDIERPGELLLGHPALDRLDDHVVLFGSGADGGASSSFQPRLRQTELIRHAYLGDRDNARGTKSLQTPRWREKDSNCRSHRERSGHGRAPHTNHRTIAESAAYRSGISLREHVGPGVRIHFAPAGSLSQQ